MANQIYRIKSRLWLESEQGTFLAAGRVQLLLSIIKNKSINAAAKDMKMSYKKAWELVNKMNTEAHQPLVIRSSGGINGGGTTVTEYGLKMIDLYEELNSKCQDYLEKELEQISF